MEILIGGVALKSRFILAPMAGYSDPVFRLMCQQYGAGLTCTEMVSAKGLFYKNKKTEDLLLTLDGESPKAVQIFGHDPETMAEAVKNPLLSKFDIIDINMGCPAKKIISNGDGSALLNDFDLARKIIEACVSATKKPITVKFRIGYNDNIVATEFAKMCESAGAAAIAVHGRTTAQGYSGEVNIEAIKQVKQAVKIPVFANGDCRSFADAQKILEHTGADGIMIGRGALGRPEIFCEVCGKDFEGIDKFNQIKSHYLSLLELFSEHYVVRYMRGHLAYYLSGKYKNSKLLVELLREEKVAQILEKLGKFLKNL